MTIAEIRGRGRPSIAEHTSLPPNVLAGLPVRSMGGNWKQSAEAAGLTPDNFKKWIHKNPLCNAYIDNESQSHIDQSYLKAAKYLPTAIDKLIEILESSKSKDYVKEKAIIDLHTIVTDGLTNRKLKEQFQQMQEGLNAIECGRVTDTSHM